MNTLLSRFLHYLTFHTRSDATNPACPSSEGQLVFARALFDEMTGLGLAHVTLDEHGYLTACLPGNQPDAPAIGLIAHMDTADYEAGRVVPQIVENYQGGDICLGKGDEVLAIRQYRFLKNYLGQDLITTDGTTLLGADDKAGIAEILTAVEYLQAHPEIPRGDLWIGFTPDEEIGRGADLFPLDRFPAKWAYTVDGGELGDRRRRRFADLAGVHVGGPLRAGISNFCRCHACFLRAVHLAAGVDVRGRSGERRAGCRSNPAGGRRIVI